MPRETVRDAMGSFDVHVGWTKEGGDVQVATEMRPAKAKDAPKNLHELVRAWEKADGYIASDPEHTDGPRGLWATLTREDINQLIRILRRARDQAFGRDE